MHANRRDFLIQSAWAALFATCPKAVHAALSNSEQIYLAIGDGAEEASQKNPYQKSDSKPGAVLFLNSDGLLGQKQPSVLRFPTPFRPHSINQSKQNSKLFAVFEKWGPHFAIVELSDAEEEARVPKFVVSERNIRFFGHGVFSEDGKLIFASQYDDSKHHGIIGVYESSSGKKVGELNAFGTFPHDCQLDERGRLLVINRRGSIKGQSTVNLLNWIDPASGKLIESLELQPTSKAVSTFYHFQQMKNGWVVVSGAAERNPSQHPGCVMAIGPDRKVMEIPKDLKGHVGESLSIGIVPSNETTVAISSPEGNAVHFWDFLQNKVVDQLSVKAARGLVSIASDSLLVSSGTERSLWSYHLKRKILDEVIPMKGQWGNGAHLQAFRIKGPIKRRV